MSTKRLDEVKLVIRSKKNSRAILVVEILGDIKIPFVFIDNKPIRGDEYAIDKPRVNENIFSAMMRQAAAILSKKVKSTRKETKIISTSDLSSNELARFNHLANFKSCPLTNGGIKIYRWRIRNEKMILISQIYKDVESAIRAQEYIVDSYKLEIKQLPKARKNLEHLITYTAGLKEILILEKECQKKNLFSAFHILKALSGSPDSTLYKNPTAEIELNKTLCYLQSVWSNPFFEPAQSAIEIINYAKQFLPTSNPDGLRALTSSAATILES